MKDSINVTWEQWQFYKASPYTHILYVYKKRNEPFTEKQMQEVRAAAKQLKISSRDIKSRYIRKYLKTEKQNDTKRLSEHSDVTTPR